MRRACTIALVLLAATAAAQAAAADDFPSRPIRIIVPVPAGGITDIAARVAGDFITSRLGQPVVIENRTGGGTNLGVEAVARSAPDGYTLSLAATSQIAISPFTAQHLGFDPLKDLVPVA